MFQVNRLILLIYVDYPGSPDLTEISNSLCAERIFEDHENLVENLLNWTRDSQNRLMFTERIEKYALFKNPQVRCMHTQTHGRVYQKATYIIKSIQMF